MQIQKKTPLVPYTSFKCGGPAENLVICQNEPAIHKALEEFHAERWVLGYGTNVLISDQGLPGLTLVIRDDQKIAIENDVITAEAGVWWDDLVQIAIKHDLWGLELMSGIPSSVGGAVAGNIAAYGQKVSDSLAWIEVLDIISGKTERLDANDIKFDYRSSSLQNQRDLIILRAAFKLSRVPTQELTYRSALSLAHELKQNPEDLKSRRTIIMETRKRAGSLYDPINPKADKTAGSFFKNPVVDATKAAWISSFDETGKSVTEVMNQNKVHGGENKRVSAAHVLLAAGFKRGQSWGQVRLHPDHILKIENKGGACAQEIYDVAQEIIKTVETKLDIVLEPEVKFLGSFD